MLKSESKFDVPQGRYLAKFLACRDDRPPHPEYGQGLEWQFEIVLPEHMRGKVASRNTALEPTTRNSCGRFLKQLAGNPVEPDEDVDVEQFKGKINFGKLINVLVAPLQECETVAWQLYGLRAISTATAAQLDAIGDIFAVPRAGQDDDEYRQAIRLKIYEIGVSGTPDELMTVLKAVTGSTEVDYFPVYPGGVGLSADAETLPPGILEFMTRLAAAGVQLWIYAYEGLLPIGVGGESGQAFVLVNGQYLETNDGPFLTAGEDVEPLPLEGMGILCDIDPDGTFITDIESGYSFDVLQAA